MDEATLTRFTERLRAHAAAVEATLAALLPPPETPLAEAMRYATLGGGKRLRAFLAMESAALFHAPAAQALRAAAAVECVHAYSLVHDDMPCMDDDDTRRGQPTVHVKWDEATAVLAGDALQALAFEILAAPQGGIDPRMQVRLIHRLAQAAGAAGMVGGQSLDLAAERAAEPLDLAAISGLQALKTGALIVWAAEAGAILGRSDPEPMRRYAADLGLAFQIRDDIIDVEGDPETAGKRVGKDAAAGKATFVGLLGLDGARARARELAASACDALAPYGSAAETLRQAAAFVVERPA
ncbi:polyprenyl synthetase family protein [Amaricoccus sp.]|uniref:polyprenyl synthetase family protein n=1 Tax=Amaricoccus sp. TaxID=1872485 RepID=UPI001B74A4FF|nr:farnesyl diphosphate synthase [Amaricoccus sp.]MBP7000390.1 polyprenyl synthetase family protein [Amaricoccus sp.]